MALLQVTKLVKQFAGLRAVDDVSFTVARGELLGLIGPNGAGKTTLFNCIAGALPPTSGRVQLLSQDITAADPARVARLGLARTYQNLRVFSDITVFDNVSVGAVGRQGVSLTGALLPWLSRARDERIAEATLAALRRFDLLDQADQPAGNLAYGQKKLLEIARACALEPQLLLLDEPAAGLNERETADLCERLLALREAGLTLLLVEHDMPMVMRLCDRIVVLESGRKIADDTPTAVRADAAVQAAYLGSPS